MKWICFTLLSIFLLGKEVAAQHCEYDYSYIIVLDVCTDSASGIIPGLKITALDSNNVPITGIHLAGEKWVTDTLRFWPNAQLTTQNHYTDNEHPLKPAKIRFWFADNNYVLVVGDSNIPKIRSVKIEDVDGSKNGGSFKTIIVPVNSANFFPLCTNASHWDLGKDAGFVKGYAPKIILLPEK